jgi:hypothetical protein
MSWRNVSIGLEIEGICALGAIALTYLVDVLALKLGDQGVETVRVDLSTNGLKDGGDVLGGGGGVATEAEEEVSSEMLHFDFVLSWMEESL